MKIVIQKTDGGVSIMTLLDGIAVEPEIEKWKGVHPGEYISHSALSGAIPDDRTFRNAWVHVEGSLSVDMPRARNILRNKIREHRSPKLQALDVEYQRSMEIGDRSAQLSVAKKKQSLRDATAHPAIEAAQTPSDLKKVWPENLP